MDENIDINPADLLLELIEVSIHNILFIRKLYPSSIFSLKKKYSIPVHVSMYPDLNHYISESLKAMKELLTVNQLDKVLVCFIDENKNAVVEKFIFNVLTVRSSFDYVDQCNDPNLIRLRETFRGFLLKLSLSDSYLKPLPEGCVFKILVQTKESGMVVLSENSTYEEFPWIEIEDKESMIVEPKLVPLRTLETESLHLEMYIECT